MVSFHIKFMINMIINFETVNFPFLDGDFFAPFPMRSYGVYISQHVHFARMCSEC